MSIKRHSQRFSKSEELERSKNIETQVLDAFGLNMSLWGS